MAQPAIQTSFASGEWAPKLRSRVDIQKYHAGASLLRNFYVDFSGGGASTRQGTRYINGAFQPGMSVRLIPFQPSSDLSYVLEFGQNYIRFFSNGAPILENAVTGGTGATGDVFTINNSYNAGDWVFATGWGGLTNVNGNFYRVTSATGTTVTVTDIFGNAVTFAGTYTSGGQLQRVYTIASPYAAGNLFPNQATGDPGIKFVQDVTSMLICHPSYPPQILTINSSNNWTLAAVTIGSTIPSPTGVTVTLQGTGSGTWQYAYAVTAVDQNGQESPVSTPGTYSAGTVFLAANSGITLAVTWTPVSGAVSYNVYKAPPSISAAVASGVIYGFMGNVTGTTFQDNGSIGADFSQTPPIPQDPFLGGSVELLTLTGNGTYTTVPGVTIASPPSGLTATAYASLAISGISSVNTYLVSVPGVPFTPIGGVLTFSNGIVLTIQSAAFISGNTWEVGAFNIANAGSVTGVGNTPPTTLSAPISLYNPNGAPLVYDSGNTVVTWDVGSLNLVQGGFGYTSAPAVTFSAGPATATSTLGPISAGNPGVPGFLQERLMLAGQQNSIQSFNFSQPASFFNFNISNPSQPDDAISGSIISDELNDIRWGIQVPTGIILGTGKGAWLVNGGGGLSTTNPITPSNIVAQPQAFNGANDLRPQKVNFDVIYGTNKGSYFRDLTYNIYANIYTGQDISVLSNHLFFGYFFLDIAWSEEPFKTMWFVRNDGVMLSLAFVKEQELIGWAHHDTNGQFKSVVSVIETVNGNVVDAVYVVVQREVNGGTQQFIERYADRYFFFGYEDSWSVDAALQTAPVSQGQSSGLLITSVTGSNTVGTSITINFQSGTGFTTGNIGNVIRFDGCVATITSVPANNQVIATITRATSYFNTYTNGFYPGMSWSLWVNVTNITGLQHLVGQSVVGVADGAVVGPLTVQSGGTVTLPAAASKVTLGLAFLPQLQTLPLDLGEPTIQSKRKKLPALSLRVADTLGLQVGTSFANAITVKDLQLGAIPSNSTGPAKVTDLFNPTINPTNAPTLDVRQVLDQLWQEPGVLCVQQNLPYPATILGVMPEVSVGDTPK